MNKLKGFVRNIIYPYNLNNDADKILKLRKKIVRGGISVLRKFFLRRKYDRLCARNRSFIPLSAKIGDNVTFPHGICGIFISQGAEIGNSAVIFHQVTIGSNTLDDSKNCGAPTIRDNVYIGAGAKIIGKVLIGNNVRIGANAVVTTDIPDNATVVLEHSRIIVHDRARENAFRSFH